MPQFNYDRPTLQLGQIATADQADIDSYINELLAQSNTVTSTGPAVAGDYVVQIAGPEGTFTFTFTAAGGENATVMTAGLLAALQMDPDLTNIVVGTDNDPALTLDFIHPGLLYTVTTTEPAPGGLLAVAETQAPGGVDLGLGLGVVSGSAAEFVIAPTGASADGDVLGITIVGTVEIMVNDGLSTSEDVFLPGCSCSVMEEGTTVVMSEDAVAFNGDVFMRITAGAGGTVLGAFRSDAAGGEAIQITRAKFRGATTGAGLVRVKLNRP